MSLSEAVLGMLNEYEDTFKDAAESGNPIPTDGTWTCLFKKIKVDRRKASSGDVTVVKLGFQVLNEGEFSDYCFSIDCWLSNQMAHVLIMSLAAASAGKPVKTLAEAIQELFGAVEKTAFDLEVTREKKVKDGKEKVYTNTKALRKVEIGVA